MKKPLSSLFLLFAAGGVSHAASLVVKNPSFESQSFNNGQYSGSITDWNASGGFVENPSEVANEFGAAGVINGSTNYAGIEGTGSALSQALTTDGTAPYLITTGDVFIVSVDLGRRGRSVEDSAATLAIQIVNAADVNQVYASTTLNIRALVSVGSNTNTGNPWAVDAGQWLILSGGNQSPNASNTFTLTTDGAGVGSNAMIRFVESGGGQIAIDNVSVSVIPEPSSALLMGAVAVLGMARRRRL